MTPQELKRSILLRAIQGKLVSQCVDDGSPDSILSEIKKDKEQLIKAKLLKKEKLLTPVSEDEIPFEIPDNWRWVRLGECGAFVRGSGIKKDETSMTGRPCVRYGQLYTTYNTRFDKAVSFVPDSVFEKCQKVHKNDVLMALTGENNYDIALAVAYEGEEELAMGGDMTKFTHHHMNPLYLVYAINSAYGISCKSKLATGNIIVHISNDKLASIPIPLPPLAEQHRIVAKIEELLPYIDRYEKAWTKLEEFNKKFPGDMQKSILQTAIQGKLVEQRAEEGTGEELFKRIQKEKSELIKAKKIKKDKLLPDITEDESDISIPDNWILKKIALLSSKITDGEHKTPKRTEKFCGFYLLSARNIRNGYLSLDDVDYVDEDEYDKISKRCNPLKGDVLISCSGSVGRCAVVNDSNKYVMVRSAAMISPILMDSDYLLFALQSEFVQAQIRNRTKQTAQANLFQEAIRNLVIPVPPLREQERIVAKLKEILPLCDKLKEC